MKEKTAEMQQSLIQEGLMSEEKLLQQLDTSENGLSTSESRNRLTQFGDNKVDIHREDSVYLRFFRAFINPFSLVLILLAIISYISNYVIQPPQERDLTTVIIILFMVALSGVLRFVQEGKSTRASEKLTKMITTTATVRRNGQEMEVPLEEIVPGDIVVLHAGDMIPADIRIFAAKDLFVNESAMTGENESVEKLSTASKKENVKSAFELEDLAFMGTNVVSGSGEGVVITTGAQTLFGSLSRQISTGRKWTSFDYGVNEVSKLLIKIMAVTVPVVFVINGLTKGNWFQAFLFALSVAVGLTPEMLPMVVTTNLARGAVRMSKYNTIVKNLDSIQNFGAMDVLCTDKTGTLTENKVVMEGYYDVDGKQSQYVLRACYLNSYYQTGLRNLMDHAVIERANEEGISRCMDHYHKADEIPFDFKRRRMSVLIADGAHRFMITKGAVEEMITYSTQVYSNNEVTAMTEDDHHQLVKAVNELNHKGMRVIGIAAKKVDSNTITLADEQEMIFIGYAYFMDPPKKSAKEAVKRLQQQGIAVKVLTGDNEEVTRYICSQVGISDAHCLNGDDLMTMSDEELRQVVDETTIFAKLNPTQKARVVQAVRATKHVTGFMGDGINDASALKNADVGISVDTAVDIAKESADIILLERSLLVLSKGVEEGRKTFANIIKYIKMTVSSNFGNIFSMLIASACLPFLPMQPIQVLVLNLIYDISCISIPWDNVDEDYLNHPHNWNAKSITKFMLWFGPTSSIFDCATFAFLFWVLGPMILGIYSHDNALAFSRLFDTGWFIESLWTQTFVIYTLRTKKLPFLQSTPSKSVMLFTVLSIVVGTVLPATFIGHSLGFVTMPILFYGWLAAVVVVYILLVTLLKHFYIKQYGSLL